MAVIKDRYQLEIETSGATAGLTRLKGALPVAGFVAAGAAALAFSKQMLDSQKVIEGYRNRLRLITDGQADLEETFGTLAQSARKTRTELGSTIELFQKLTIATEEMRVSEEDVLTVTEQLSKALAVAGADAATTSSVVRQFGQAMASGTVRGDEFNSLVEGLGPALAIMARESGITVGELREMSQAGELTASVMFDMLKNSNSLNESFAKLAPTTEQLTTQLGESWTYATAQLGEYLGVQEAANNGLLLLTRTLDSLSENPAAPLVDMETQDIIQGVKDGAIEAESALRELQDRVTLASTGGARLREAFDFSNTNEGVDELSASLLELEAYLSAVEVAAQRDAGVFGEITQSLTETGREIQKINKEQQVFAQSLGLGAEQAAEFGKFIEDLNNKITENIDKDEQVSKAIEHFNYMLDEGIITVERHAEAMKLLGETTEETRKVFEDSRSSFEEFYSNLIENSRQTVTEQTNAMQAQKKLGEELAAGKINIDQYAEAMSAINSILGITTEETIDLTDANKRLQDTIDGINQSTQERIQSAKDSAELDGLRGIEKELRQIEISENRIAEAAKKRLREQAASAGISIDTADLDSIDIATRHSIELQQELAMETYNNQRSFATGWKNAFEEYKDAATDNSKLAADVFNRFTRGMEDSIVEFARTGKFSMKDFLADIAEMILRSQVQRLIAQIFGGSSLFGGTSQGNFAGGFANGGTIPSGQFGIVGENGPEFISGPANITPMGSGGSVTYNINAVDAPSFQQLIARDPQFIHAVSEQGRRGIPAGRR